MDLKYFQKGAILAGLVCVTGQGMAEGEDLTALWSAVISLDSGPGQVPKTAEEAKGLYGKHVAQQETVLRRFLGVCGQDARLFEARMRLARVLTIRAEMEGKSELQSESEKLLDSLDAEGTREQRAEVAFTRISQWMRRNRFPNATQRQELLAATREFKGKYGADRRLARLLAEVATRFDREPEVKRELLEGALRANPDADLKKRVLDDQVRLDLLGKVLPLRFTDLNGRQFRLEDYRGKAAVLIYFSAGSAPALEAWKVLNDALRKFPEMLRIGISLDEDRVAMERARKVYGENWVIAWEGRGWLGSLARRWGINVLPTVWLLDAKGALVSLDAMEDLAGQLGALKGD